MKRSYISFIVIALALSVCAQAPLSFKYQAYLRNADGTIRGSEFVTLQLKIVQGTINGSTVYSEVHNTSTNAHGLVSVSLGDGTSSFNMSAIQWKFGPFFLDITVNGIHLGTTELLSVPFALYANETGSSFSGEYSDLSGAPNLATVATSGNYLHLTSRPKFAMVATTGNYNSLLNIPTTFLPSSHTHLEADIGNLAHYTDDSISGTEAAFTGWDKDESDDFVGDMARAAITNLADPVNPQDAATKSYVDASSGSFSGSFNDLTNVPLNLDLDATNDFSGSFNDLTNVPLSLDLDATDDFSGSFNDLTNVPLSLDLDATDDFDGNYISLTNAPAQIGDLGGDMGGFVITNLAMPAAPGATMDAVNRAYVDALEDRVATLEGLVGTLTTDMDALKLAVAALTARVTAHEIAYP